jgi:hypothetical protein
MTTLLDILQPLGEHVDFTYTLEGSRPVISAEEVNLSATAIEYLATLTIDPDLLIEVRKGNLIIRERV